MSSLSEIIETMSDTELTEELWLNSIKKSIELASELDCDYSMMLFAYLKGSQNRMIRYLSVSEQRVIDRMTDSPQRIKDDVVNYLQSL